MKILVLNAGSSTQKCAVFDFNAASDEVISPIWEGRIEWSQAFASVTTRSKTHQSPEERIPVGPTNDHIGVTRRMLEGIWTGPGAVVSSAREIDLVGHRIVHGGPYLRETVVVSPKTKHLIESAAPFAPLHNQMELEGVNLCEEIFSHAQQVAVFDTSFHRTMPQFATLYPGPYEWAKKGIFRYGFHGINHEYCAKRAASMLHRDLSSPKLVTCHLGNGCSLAAIADGKSVDTTMGFTPLDGLMMGTRSGAIDPAILIYLAQRCDLSPEQIDSVLNYESGLLGISGHSSDMREIVRQMKEGHPRSRLAFDMFIHILCKGIAAMAAAINGMDVLVFTAGIGENSPDVREAACNRLSFLGVKIDLEKNISPRGDNDLSAADSSVRILKIRAQEDWAIARECSNLRQESTRTVQ